MSKIEGTVAPGYEAIKDMLKKANPNGVAPNYIYACIELTFFFQNLDSGIDINCQVCAYVKGERVVDLWCNAPPSYSPDTDYGPDTLQIVFSSTKSLAAICIACMVDKGLIDYEEKVSKYWPEFAQKGKNHLKVCDILRCVQGNSNSYQCSLLIKIFRHESGLTTFDHVLLAKDWLPENIKQNSIGKVIEQEERKLPPESSGTNREYHELSRGHILNEIFRRVEPQGRTIGEYLREEISKPLEADVYVHWPQRGRAPKDERAPGHGPDEDHSAVCGAQVPGQEVRAQHHGRSQDDDGVRQGDQ